MELTGTNRSNPLEPQPKIKAWPENRRRAAASAKPRRQTRGASAPPGRRHVQRCSVAAHFPHQTTDSDGAITVAESGRTGPAPICPAARQSSGGRQSPGAATAWWSKRGAQTPDPIPNSAVKTLSADGTASEDAEEQVAARLSQPPIPPPAQDPPPTAAAGRSSPAARQAHNRRDPATGRARPADRRTPPPVPGSSPGTIRGPRSTAPRGVEQPGSSSGS